MRKPYVSIDIETTGLNPATCQVLSVGAVIDDLSNPTVPIDELPFFLVYVRHEEVYGEHYAIAMNAGIIAALSSVNTSDVEIVDADNLADVFSEWLIENGIDLRKKIVVAGKNFASFDARFLYNIPNWDTYMKFHHRVLDPAMLYFDPELDHAPPSLQICLDRAGTKSSVSHDALQDALDVVKVIRVALANE